MSISILPMDPRSLYRVHQYTDNTAGTIYEKIPVVKTDKGYWDDDPLRLTIYTGQTYINSQPLNFPIDASSLSEAIDLFASTVASVLDELRSQAVRERIANPVVPKSTLIVGGSR